jgi:hypothetical protein
MRHHAQHLVQDNIEQSPNLPNFKKPSAGSLEQSMGDRNREEIGLSYLPAGLLRLAVSIYLESIPGFLKSLKIPPQHSVQDYIEQSPKCPMLRSPGIEFKESIPELLKILQSRAHGSSSLDSFGANSGLSTTVM